MTTTAATMYNNIPEEDEQEESDRFLVCVFNVSLGVAHTILQASRTSTAAQVVAQALSKSRRTEDPASFVLIEQTETQDLRKKLGKKVVVERELGDDENVYLVQRSWVGQGKLLLRERPPDLHPSVRETQSEPIYRGSPRLRRPNNLVGRVRKFSRSLYSHDGLEGEVVSDGDLEEEQDEFKTRKSSMAHLRKLKIW